MFEARFLQAQLLKKIVTAIKDLVETGNFDVSSNGLALQGMDSSHVSLVSLFLRSSGFYHFRADRNLSLGLDLANVGKILKCSADDDVLTLRSEDNPEHLTFMFESKDQDKISDFELKLMDIDSEHLGIPVTNYTAIVKMPSAEFQRITRDLGSLGDTMSIAVSKDGVKFSVKGDIGTGNIMVKQNDAADKEEADATTIELQAGNTMEQSFAVNYLNNFAKAVTLAPSVTLSMAEGLPMVVAFDMGDVGYLRYYLAPKVEDQEGEGGEKEAEAKGDDDEEPKKKKARTAKKGGKEKEDKKPAKKEGGVKSEKGAKSEGETPSEEVKVKPEPAGDAEDDQ